MGRGRKKQPEPVEEVSDQLDSDTLFDARGNAYRRVAKPVDQDVSTDVDSVDLLLGQDYTQDIVDEVKKYPKPPFDAADDSLDPVEDFQEYVDYNLKFPPAYHDLAMRAAEEEIMELEQLKGPIDPELARKVEQRRQLVAGKPLEDVKWLKHKAYYRAMQRLHAAREAEAKEEREQYLTAKGAPLDAVPADIIDLSPQQYVERAKQVLKHEAAAAEAAMGPSSSNNQQQQEEAPEPWDTRWTAPGYDKHPQVVAQLAAAVAEMGWWGLPITRRQHILQLQKQQQQGFNEATEALSNSESSEEADVYVAQYHPPAPFQAYTPEYLAKINRREAAQRYQRRKQQAFWLSLGAVFGTSMIQWLRRRGKGKGRYPHQQQQQQRGLQRQQSELSTPRRTPSVVSG
jgi:hypothetical protein